MTSKKRKLDAQFILAIGVLIISVAALIVSIRQASIMNRQTDILLQQTKANAWPSLSISLHSTIKNDTINSYLIKIANKGTGPAIVEGVRFSYQEESFQRWDEFFKRIQIPDSVNLSRSTSSIYNRVIAEGEEVELINFNGNWELIEWVYAKGKNIKIEVCYKSVFEDYWLIHRDGIVSNEISKVEATEGCIFEESEMFLE